MTEKRLNEFFEETMGEDGRYEIYCAWKGSRSAHVFLAERKNGVIRFFDPQTGKSADEIKHYFSSMKGDSVYTLRIDNKIINPKMATAFEKAALTQEQVFAQAIEQAKTMEELAAAKKAYTGDLAIGSDLRKKWAEKRAEIRNATRSEKERKAIEARIEQRSKDIASFDKFKATAGANIKANAGQLAWFDAKQLAELDKLQNRPLAYRAKAKEMAQQVAAIRKDIKELETLIPDVQTQWSKQFSSEELHGVFDSVKKKIADIESAPLNIYKYTDHLDQQAAKYKFEIYDYLGGNMGGVQNKYKTWKVSQAAYTKQLEAVEDKIWHKQATAKVADLDALFASHSNSAKLHGFIDEAKTAFAAGDKGAFAAKAQEAEAWSDYLDKLTAQRKAREARKKGAAVTGDLYAGGSPYTPDEIKEAERLKKKMLDAVAKSKKDSLRSLKLESICDEYADYMLDLSRKYYGKQLTTLTTAEEARLRKILKDYLNEMPTNPHTVWGDKVGGVYNSMTRQREALAKELAGITSDELSLVTRFTSGMTFYNAYNLRATSPYWANVWKNKMAMLTSAEQKVMERIIGEYTEALTLITDKLQRYDGVVYRGVHSGGAVELRKIFEEAWNNGTRTWKNNAAASSSTSIRVSVGFDDKRDGDDLIMIIKNKTGGYIRPISEYNYEREVLLIKDKEYRMLKAPYQREGKTWVELEEI